MDEIRDGERDERPDEERHERQPPHRRVGVLRLRLVRLEAVGLERDHPRRERLGALERDAPLFARFDRVERLPAGREPRVRGHASVIQPVITPLASSAAECRPSLAETPAI